MANNENGIYAGDKAWRDWFDICSVAGCPDKEAEALRRQITAMLFFRLASHGIGQDAVGGEDPVAFFDSYFLLKGCRDKSKPLGIATYQTLRSIPKPYKTLAPVIEGVRRVLSESVAKKTPKSTSRKGGRK